MVRIDLEKCVGCGQCIPFCPDSAISLNVNGKASVDEEVCVECYACIRANICPTNAIEKHPLEWPRIIRHLFSGVVSEHKDTRVPGRGTEEMKTNDVTGRFKPGEIGFSIDVGRPGIGTKLSEVNKLTMKLAKVNVEFEPMNPITLLMIDKSSGKLREDILNERVRSVVVEFKVKKEQLPHVLKVLRQLSSEVDTVFSVGCITVFEDLKEVQEVLGKFGFEPRINGKTNIGLGRPVMGG